MQSRRLLLARGITTFLDRDNLVTGLPWRQALEQALRGARAVAVFIGRQLGGWQKREMWYALDRQVSEEKQGRAFPVVPVLLPGAELTPGFLFSNTWVDLRSGSDGPEATEALGAIEAGDRRNCTRARRQKLRSALPCCILIVGWKRSARKTPPFTPGGRPSHGSCSVSPLRRARQRRRAGEEARSRGR